MHQQLRYDALGRRRWQSSGFQAGQLTRPEDGVLWRVFRYTGRGELAGVSDALRGDIHYGYDPEGRLLQHRERRQGNPGNRLRYDAADNLLDEKDPVGAIPDNRLAHWQRLFCRYDSWGNLLSRRNGEEAQHYTYDADNRLIHARGRGPAGAQYHYDALGRRSRKTVRVRVNPRKPRAFCGKGIGYCRRCGTTARAGAGAMIRPARGVR